MRGIQFGIDVDKKCAVAVVSICVQIDCQINVSVWRSDACRSSVVNPHRLAANGLRLPHNTGIDRLHTLCCLDPIPFRFLHRAFRRHCAPRHGYCPYTDICNPDIVGDGRSDWACREYRFTKSPYSLHRDIQGAFLGRGTVAQGLASNAHGLGNRLDRCHRSRRCIPSPPDVLGLNMVKLAAEQISVMLPVSRPVGGAAMSSGVHERRDRLRVSSSGRILGVQALEGVTVSLSAGDRLALIGKNGSGKTTLLQALSGILIPDTGRVVSEGVATNLININLGMQPEATGHRNITLRGLAAGQSRSAIEAKRADIAAFCELGQFLDLPLSSYSAGMRIRLNFAIATAFDPEILLLDEWLSAGDASFRRRATERMQTFVDKAGILILASHSDEMLRKNCNLALWLDDGQVRDFGAIDDVLDRYQDSIGQGATAA